MKLLFVLNIAITSRSGHTHTMVFNMKYVGPRPDQAGGSLHPGLWGLDAAGEMTAVHVAVNQSLSVKRTVRTLRLSDRYWAITGTIVRSSGSFRIRHGVIDRGFSS